MENTKSNFDPNKQYQWKPNDRVTIDGATAQAIIQLGNFMRETGLALLPMIGTSILKNLVDQGVALEYTTQEDLKEEGPKLEVVEPSNKKEEQETQEEASKPQERPTPHMRVAAD